MTFFQLKNSLFGTFCFVGLLACTPKPSNQEDKENVPTSQPALFTLLPAEQTGVLFQNSLNEGLNTNILMYEYFYNGGGVAAGDFNGDGKTDLYFTSNMGENKLYLNNGGMQFKDITAGSGAEGRPGPWKTGISVVDINSDGKLDLYLCYSGAMPAEKRANQLFINEGNDANGLPHFTEKAAEYGLDSQAFSNQAYFFDYDRDGDLDALLLNHNPKNLPMLNEEGTATLFTIDDADKGLRLFTQTNGHFDDITKKAGINGSALSYGLGVGIGDFNDDGWSDFYVSNDYNVPDYLYINQQNGTFRNQLSQSIGHTSQFSMGNDAADINNDGRDDIFTLDMLPEDNHRQKLLLAPDNFAKFDLNVRSGFYYQYMRNMLHLNNGNGTFSEVGQVAGVSNTDWSWSALLADYDNDGYKDLFVSNGYLHDYTNMDFIKYMDSFVQARGRLQREDVLDIIAKMPASNVVNYIFQNNQGVAFTNQTQNWGLNRASNSNGAAYADLDNDGDMDLVVNNINQPAFIYRNDADKLTRNNYLQIKLQGTQENTQGIGSKITLSIHGAKQTATQTLMRGYLSAVSPVLHFGLGKETTIDTLQIVWASGKQQTLTLVKANQTLELKETDAKEKPAKKAGSKALFSPIPPPLAYQNTSPSVNDFDRQLLLTTSLSHTGPCMAKGDVTNDGLEDVVVGGAAGQSASLFVQQKNGGFVLKPAAAFEADKNTHDAAIAIFDANADGFADIYIASGGYHTFAANDPLLQDRLYINDGKGNFTKNTTSLPSLLTSKSCVAVHDVNGDNRADVFVGGRVVPGRYPESPNSHLLLNTPTGTWQTIDLGKIGMVTDAVWVDLNQDNRKELVVVGEWMPVSVWAFESGKMTNQTTRFFDKLYSGWWNTIAIGDFNKDGKPDLMIGNWGTNSQVKASDKHPAEMYFKDFDTNGTIEPVLCTYIQGKSYPYVTRDEFANQINGFRTRYPSYESYADVTIQDIFGTDVAGASRLQANQLQTTCFVSTKNGKFTVGTLPVQAQYAPVHTLTVLDADQDGNEDVLLCGNTHHAKIRLGQMNANFGVLLLGNGTGEFRYVEQTQSGLQLQGDVRSVIQLNSTLVFGIHGKKSVAYKLSIPRSQLALKAK
jgi:hypothetical protein